MDLNDFCSATHVNNEVCIFLQQVCEKIRYRGSDVLIKLWYSVTILYNNECAHIVASNPVVVWARHNILIRILLIIH